MGKEKTLKDQVLKKISFKFTKLRVINFSLFLVLIFLICATYYIYIIDRYIYNVSIADTNIAFLTKEQAFEQINSNLSQRSQTQLKYDFDKSSYTIDLIATNPTINYSKALDEAFSFGHSSDFILAIQDQIKALVYGYSVIPEIKFNANAQIDKIAKQIDQPAQNATIWLDEQNIVHTKEGVIGTSLDKTAIEAQITSYILFGYYPGTLPIKNTDPNFTTNEALQAQKALEAIKQQPVELTFENRKWNIDVPTLFYLLSLDKSLIEENDDQTLFDNTKLDNYLKDIALRIDRPVEEPLFEFDSTNKRVTEFKPAQLGQELDQAETRTLIANAIGGTQDKKITLPVKTINPKIQTSEINNLGIRELIGQGVSNFAGSIPNRIYNVNLTANRINGILISPGQTFSFNNTVGEISGATGFKQAYVIKEGRTVLDDGGGVCQVSTTLFRTVLNAGLPITERTAHAYRVSYYEQGFQPGIDATIYNPSVDFKFKNDTPASILIQARVEGTTLYVDFYGTSDGRKVEMTTPVITEQTPPPPELRQDDPTLARGQVKQVDWAAWGAKVSFKRTVTKDGEVLSQETWRSNYRPWQAVYLVGTKD